MTGHLRIQIVKTQWLITGWWWEKINKKTFEKNLVSLSITISVIPTYFCPFYQFSDIWENIAFTDVALASLSLNTFYTLGIIHSRSTKIRGHSLMYAYVLLFCKICSLTYFHVKIYGHVHEAKNILRAFLAKKNQFETILLFLEKINQTYLLINKGPSCLFENSIEN